MRNIPLSEYPRPQFRRDSYLCLNGIWNLAFSKSINIPDIFPLKVLVPYPVESSLSLINRNLNKNEYLYYYKEFSLPKDFNKGKVILHFDAVDQVCDIVFNNKEVFKHAGGYIPFEVDITPYLEDNNKLVVRVLDNLDRTYGYGKQSKASHGMWYTKTSGIWKTVWLESVPLQYFKSVKISTTLEKVSLKIDSNIRQKELIIKTPQGMIRKEFSKNEIEVRIPNPELWTPSHPYLYEFTLKAKEDVVESYFAMRTIKVGKYQKNPCLLLNDKPYFFHGLLDQGYFKDGILTPESYQCYEDEIKLLKELGFNTLRKHIKIEPLYFYYLCDKLGMIVFQDFVNNGKYSFFKDTVIPTLGKKKDPNKGKHQKKKYKDEFKKEMFETIDLLYNSPSVLYYTIFNEGWGQFDADEMFDLVKAKDKSRIVDTTSGWFASRKSDVDSKHIYFKKIKFEVKDKPVVISEFGGYVYKDHEHSFNTKRPYGYKIFKDLESYQKGVKHLYAEEIEPFVLRGLSGAIYTQVSDVENETNGLFTYDRKVLKIKEKLLNNINKD